MFHWILIYLVCILLYVIYIKENCIRITKLRKLLVRVSMHSYRDVYIYIVISRLLAGHVILTYIYKYRFD